MSATHVRTKTAVTVQLADGRSEAYPPGQVLALDDLSESLRSRLEEGEEYTSALFEESDAPEEEEETDWSHLQDSSASEQGGPIQTRMGEEQIEELQGAEGAGVVHSDREGAHAPAHQPEPGEPQSPDPGAPQQSSGELQQEELQGAEGADEAQNDGEPVEETDKAAAETEQGDGEAATPKRRSRKGGQ